MPTCPKVGVGVWSEGNSVCPTSQWVLPFMPIEYEVSHHSSKWKSVQFTKGVVCVGNRGTNGLESASDMEQIYIFFIFIFVFIFECEYRSGSLTVMKIIIIFDRNENKHERIFRKTDIDTNFKKII